MALTDRARSQLETAVYVALEDGATDEEIIQEVTYLTDVAADERPVRAAPLGSEQ